MIIKVIRHEWKNGLFYLSLSDCWMEKGKPVRFRVGPLKSKDPAVKAYGLILGPINAKIGWFTLS